MPQEFGAWSVHNRFRQWRDTGLFEALLEGMIAETECEDVSIGRRDITVSGTVAPNEKLELRLGSWTFASWEYLERNTYAPPV